jgi:peptidoglycan-N-acetylglucosamine deacetylase
MKLYLTKTPRIIQKIYKNYTWRFSRSKKEIFLTFDDGPTPEITDWVLDTLKEYNAKATFFCIGKNIKEHPDIYTKITLEKHAIGNHTQNHLNGFEHTVNGYLENVLEVEKTLKLLNAEPLKLNLFRPPYGRMKRKQAQKIRSLGYKIIMWDVLSADFDTISKEKCLKNVLKSTKNGSIIVFHDSVKAAEKLHYALPKILAHFSQKGYQFKAIS